MNGVTLVLLTCLAFAWVVIYRQQQDLKVNEVDNTLSAFSHDYYIEELQRSSEIIGQLSRANTALLLAQAECRCADMDSRKKSLTLIGGEGK